MHTKRQFDSLSLRPAKVFSFAAVNDPRKTNRRLTEMELQYMQAFCYRGTALSNNRHGRIQSSYKGIVKSQMFSQQT